MNLKEHIQSEIKSQLGESVINEVCWDNYKQVGMKTKGGKQVPNCVPEGLKEGIMSQIHLTIKSSSTEDEFIKKFFKQYDKFFHLPEQYPGVKTPWLAFPLVIKKNNVFNRKQLQIFFEKNKIQTRTIFTGNLLKQPAMKNRYYKKHNQCNIIADDVMKNGILLGCHQGMVKKELDYICNKFKILIKKQ